MAESHQADDVNTGKKVADAGGLLQKKLEEARQKQDERVRQRMATPDFESIARQGGAPQLPANDPGWSKIEQGNPKPTPKKVRPARTDLMAKFDAPVGQSQNDAAAVVHQFVANAKRELKVKEKILNDPTKQYYMECHVCNGPGIFFVVKPLGEVPADQWFSTYKDVTHPWMQSNAPVCQCCMDEGLSTPLRVLWRDTKRTAWQPNQRFVKEIDKTKLTAAPEPQEVTNG